MVEVEAGGGLGGAGGGQLGFGAGGTAFKGGQVGAGHQLLGAVVLLVVAAERPLAAEPYIAAGPVAGQAQLGLSQPPLGLGFPDPGPGAAGVGAGLVEGHLIRGGVDQGEGITAAHLGALLEEEALDRAAHLRPHLHRHQGLHLGANGIALLHRPQHHRRGLHQGRRPAAGGGGGVEQTPNQ